MPLHYLLKFSWNPPFVQNLLQSLQPQTKLTSKWWWWLCECRAVRNKSNRVAAFRHSSSFSFGSVSSPSLCFVSTWIWLSLLTNWVWTCGGRLTSPATGGDVLTSVRYVLRVGLIASLVVWDFDCGKFWTAFGGKFWTALGSKLRATIDDILLALMAADARRDKNMISWS